MHLERRLDADGTRYYVRPPFRPEDYHLDRNSVRAIEAWRGDRFPTEALIELRDGPFSGWTELARFERDGARWARLYNTSGEYGVDVELVEAGLGRVVELDPRAAYDLAVAADAGRSDVRPQLP
jgi:hypothetical protein